LSPQQISAENWRNIQEKLQGLREQVYRGMLAAGPQTTCDLAEIIAMPLLTVRPRVTELCELGLAEPAGRAGRHGLYQAIPLDQVKRHISEMAMDHCQLQLL
jgi:predicted transcriptional regulator